MTGRSLFFAQATSELALIAQIDSRRYARFTGCKLLATGCRQRSRTGGDACFLSWALDAERFHFESTPVCLLLQKPHDWH